MTLTTIAVAVVLVVFVVARRMQGYPVVEPRKLFLLPVVAGALGLRSLAHTDPNAVAIGVIAVGCALSLILGVVRGMLDKVSLVDGSPYMVWSIASVAVFAIGVLSKLALDLVGVAAGGTRAALTSSLLFSLALTLLGEAVVVWRRAQSLPAEGAAAGGRYRGAVHRPHRTTRRPIR